MNSIILLPTTQLFAVSIVDVSSVGFVVKSSLSLHDTKLAVAHNNSPNNFFL